MMAAERTRAPRPGACRLCAGLDHITRPDGSVATCPCMPVGYVSPSEQPPPAPVVADVEQLPADGTLAEGQEEPVPVPKAWDSRRAPDDNGWLMLGRVLVGVCALGVVLLIAYLLGAL